MVCVDCWIVTHTPPFQDYFTYNCDDWAPLTVNERSVCRQHATVFPFNVPLDAVDAALRGAVAHIGL